MKDINLYINNQEIEFSISPDILFTYQQDDLTNPTVVKNNFSKTIMIKGTPKNNKIFGEIWNVERIQGGDNYNASKRVPFSLYINGDLYTTGYAKLDKVNMVNNDINYSITLYGGLGSFLYNLSYDWNTGDKKTLKDLKFYTGSTSNTEIDFDFDFTKETVNSAWTWSNMSSTSSKWYHINFAPTYNGIPENFSADKVLINFNDLPVGTSGITSGGTAYTTYNGYALGTLPKSMTQEETRDFRAYLQTPVVRVKSVFDAICRKENNQGLYDNGFDVELDSDFFTPSNPYYWDSWMTLPMINNLEVSKKGTGSSTAYTGTYYFYSSANRGGTMVFPLDSPVTEGNMSVKIGFKVAVSVGSATTTSSTLEIASYTDINAIGVQGYASNSVASGGNALSGSRIKWLSHPSYRNGVKLTCENAIRSNTYSPMWNNYADYIEGKFNKLSDGVYAWDSVLELEFDLPIGATCFKLDFYPVNISNQSRRYLLFDFDNNAGRIYDRTYTFSSNYTWPARDIQAYIYGSDNTQYNTIRRVTKDLLLDTSYSPADWLLSYIKMFGLYIYKDEIEDKIYIKTRNNFYDRDVNHIVDIEHLIDRGNSADLNPIFCQYAHLELKNDTEESRPEKDYETKYNKTFGEKIVNTGYEFNADTKNVFEKNILKGAVQSKEVSDLFYKPDSGVHPYYWNNISYNLYENGNPTGSTYEIKPGTRDIQVAFQPYDEEYPGYDFIGKPMFADGENKPLDTANVMLFFNGYKDVSGYNWILSDDVSEMFTLNNNPCWLMSVSTANTNGVEICKKISDFPRFSRMFEGNNWMIYSWDFGSPRELYIPSMVDNPEGNIYYNYFKDFYTDLYDVDTKVIDCYIKPGLKFNNDDLRRIYWFRNRLWRLNKVTDYNPSNYNTTKCQFISINDINSLTNEDATTDLWIKVTLDKYVLPASGGTIIGTVRTSDNYGWQIEGTGVTPYDSAYTITIEPDSYGSSGNFIVTVGPLAGYNRVITINVTAGDVGGSVKFVQQGSEPYIRLVPEQLIVGKEGAVTTINVESNVDWMIGSENNNYLTFNILSQGYINWRKYSSSTNSKTIEYRIIRNGEIGNWISKTSTNSNSNNFLVYSGDTVQFRGINEKYGTDYDSYSTFSGSTASFNISGNINSLIDYENINDITAVTAFAFNYLFASCGVVDASKLVIPSSSVGSWGYSYMFKGCTSLTKSPQIMAENLGNNSCQGMFSGCTNLSEITCMGTNAGNSYTRYWTTGVSANGTFIKNPNMNSWPTGTNGIPSGWIVKDYSGGGGGDVNTSLSYVFASSEDFGEFNIEVTSTGGLDNVVNVDGTSDAGNLATGLTSGQTFSIGVQNLNSLGKGTRRIGISYAYTPNYNFVGVPSGQFTWVSGLSFEPNKIIYIQIY